MKHPRPTSRRSSAPAPLRLLATHLSRIPSPWRGVMGVAVALAGLALTALPLTSTLTLAVTLAAGSVFLGVQLTLTPAASAARRAQGIAWIIAGLAVALFVDPVTAALPPVAAGWLAWRSIVRLSRPLTGPTTSRALSIATAGAGIALAVLGLLWLDVTFLVLAASFGIWLIITGVRAVAPRSRTAPAPPAPVTQHGRTKRSAPLMTVATALATVATLVGTGLLVSTSRTLHAAAPSASAFYDAPDDLPTAPGQLLRAEDFRGATPADASVHRILYTSTDHAGSPVVASALVIAAPAPSSDPRPVVIWNHGTTGIDRSCAPSLMDNAATPDAIPGIDAAVAAGWVVVATDYAGQGTAADYPYLIGTGQARSALDGVRAAAELDGLQLSDDVAVWGHSQGGHAALWTATEAPEYAPEFDIVGTVAISPAADPLGLAESLTAGGTSGPLAIPASWVLIPYSEAYDDVIYDDYVALGGRALLKQVSSRCTFEPAIGLSALVTLALIADRPLVDAEVTSGPMRDHLAENRTLGPFPSPLLLAWGGDDEVIAPRLQHRYVADLCDEGVSFEWQEFDGLDHMGVVRTDSPFIDDLVSWTAARFAGEATASEC